MELSFFRPDAIVTAGLGNGKRIANIKLLDTVKKIRCRILFARLYSA